jgi:hypothetical protein
MCGRMFFVLACGVLPLSLGCGGSYEGPKRIPVAGTVTFDGQPLSEGHITFVPEGGDQRQATGVIANGQFNIPEEMGPNVGSYKVRIIATESAGADDAAAAEVGADMTDELATGGQQLIPPIYNDQTTLTAKIREGMEPLTFDLER